MNEKKINLFGIKKRAVLSHTKTKDVYIIQEITKAQEEELDENECILLKSPDGKEDFLARKENILLYGEVQFNEDDCKYIKSLNCIEHNDNAFVHSGFDFHKDSVTITDVPKFYSTSDPVLWFKYKYVMIGRPKRVIVYKRKYGKK